MAGLQLERLRPRPQGSPIRSVYDSAATTQAEDYDKLMGGYENIINESRNKAGRNQLNYIPINPVFNRQLEGTAYNRTGELNTALTGLEEYSKTGGYSDEDVANIRERGISPIRSIYSNAQRNLQRQKVLSGGYAPNMGAITAKMARESAGQIGDITTKVNADIAEKIASGKLNSLSALGSLSGRENELIAENNRKNNELKNQVELLNAEEQRRVDDLNNRNRLTVEQNNANLGQENTQNQLNALSGQRSLYGTTPALTQTFGQQVLANTGQNLQANQTANMIKNQRANIGLQLAGGRRM